MFLTNKRILNLESYTNIPDCFNTYTSGVINFVRSLCKFHNQEHRNQEQGVHYHPPHPTPLHIKSGKGTEVGFSTHTSNIWDGILFQDNLFLRKKMSEVEHLLRIYLTIPITT